MGGLPNFPRHFLERATKRDTLHSPEPNPSASLPRHSAQVSNASNGADQKRERFDNEPDASQLAGRSRGRRAGDPIVRFWRQDVVAD